MHQCAGTDVLTLTVLASQLQRRTPLASRVILYPHRIRIAIGMAFLVWKEKGERRSETKRESYRHGVLSRLFNSPPPLAHAMRVILSNISKLGARDKPANGT